MKYGLVLLASLFWSLSLSAQNPRLLKFDFFLREQKLELNKAYFIEGLNDSVSISSFKCYISNICITTTKRKLVTLEKKHHLLNLENTTTLILPINTKFPATAITFDIGIDSITNSKALLSGDLDPMNGMYWTWQSGFINWKIEGSSPHLTTRNHHFQYHIGGFSAPFNSLQHLTLQVNKESATHCIVVDLKPFFESAGLFNTPEVMSPGLKATALANIFSSLFSIQHACN